MRKLLIFLCLVLVTICPAFSEEESDRLDQLMKKCRDLTDELDADIWKVCKRADEKVLGKIPKKKKF